MSDMSFKQAKDLTEQFELAELTLKQTLKRIDMASKNFDKSLIEQEKVLRFMPEANEKLNTMKIIVALNIGFVVGLMISKYLF
ncbi:MAG: hypothetical protein DRG78_21300 [Epsilonproteobacteria bacterium]|nr:MAG: hypothetical protein DRG78_21300 [Campylobacterota bacterium]